MTRELDREVAEELGYHVEQIEISAQTGRPRWCLVAPDGELHHPARPYLETEDDVWEELAPPFSAEIETALGLVPERTGERGFMLRQMEGGWIATITDFELASTESACEGTGETPAEAICRAWLVWRRGKGSE